MQAPDPFSRRRNALLTERARCMRHHPTPSEQLLWSALRGRRLGVAFRRQVPLGRFIADFLAPEPRLVVEVDGGYHGRRVAADARRDAALSRLGYRVLHLEADRVSRDLEGALAELRSALAQGQ